MPNFEGLKKGLKQAIDGGGGGFQEKPSKRASIGGAPMPPPKDGEGTSRHLMNSNDLAESHRPAQIENRPPGPLQTQSHGPPPPPSRHQQSGPSINQQQHLQQYQQQQTQQQQIQQQQQPQSQQQQYHSAPREAQAPQDQRETHRKSSRAVYSRQNYGGGKVPRDVLFDEIDDLNDVIDRRERKIHDRDSEIARLQEICANLESERRRQEESLMKLQETSFKSMDNAKWVSMQMDESSINAELTNMQNDISRIAKDYAIDSLGGAIDRADMAKLRDASVAFTILENDSEKSFVELMKIRNAPRLCLTALLSHVVFKQIFANPFFFLEDSLDEKLTPQQLEELSASDRPSLAVGFQRIYQQSRHLNEREANLWRCQTLRLLNPPEHDASEASKSISGNTKSAIGDFVRRTVRSFQAGEARLLLKRMETATREHYGQTLFDLFLNASKLSVRLWCQCPALSCQFKAELSKQSFNVTSPVMQAHGVNKLDDPDDHSQDGRPIRMVVHPAVLGMGTHDAEHYDTSSGVWAKAVVWLAD